MIPTGTLAAEFTVPNLHQDLSASRPVQVYTYFFDPARPDTPAQHPPDDAVTPGAAMYFPGLRALPPHDHEHHEIAFVTAGSAVHRTAENADRMERGTILAIAPGEVHGFEQIDGLCMVNCTYLTEWLFYDLREMLTVDGLASLFFPGALQSAGRRMRVPCWSVAPHELEAGLRELSDIAAERALDAPSVLLMRRILEKLVLMLHRTYTQNGHSTALHLQPELRVALQRIEEWILQGESFRAAALADAARMSPDHFARLFRRATGWSPTDYYQNRRIHHACALLLNSAQSITDVAMTLGYYDGAHFSRLFQRHRGITPRDFRRRYVHDGD